MFTVVPKLQWLKKIILPILFWQWFFFICPCQQLTLCNILRALYVNNAVIFCSTCFNLSLTYIFQFMPNRKGYSCFISYVSEKNNDMYSIELYFKNIRLRIWESLVFHKLIQQRVYRSTLLIKLFSEFRYKTIFETPARQVHRNGWIYSNKYYFIPYTISKEYERHSTYYLYSTLPMFGKGHKTNYYTLVLVEFLNCLFIKRIIKRVLA